MTTRTKHKTDCKMAFGRKDATCPRCIELLRGAKPRRGWQESYFSNKRHQEARRKESIKKHDCTNAGCGVVCTAFDW